MLTYCRMKNILSRILPVILLLSSAIAPAQEVFAIQGTDSTTLTADTVAQLTSFTAKYREGKIYLQWTVINQHQDGIYIVYRSNDGVNFEVAGMKQGIGVPVEKDIAYYFTDAKPASDTQSYKLIHVAGDKTFLSSNKIVIVNEVPVLAKNENASEK